MQTTIQSFSDYKTNEYGPSARVKTNTGEQFYINEEPAPLVGKMVDIEVTTKTSKAGREYKIGKISKVYEATASNTNGNSNGASGKITWDAYRAMAEAAHELAVKLEPDGNDISEGSVVVDRSSARAAMVNTTMINYCQGRIFVPEIDDDMPF